MERYSVVIEVIIPATQQEKAQAYGEGLIALIENAVLENGRPFVERAKVAWVDTTTEGE